MVHDRAAARFLQRADASNPGNSSTGTSTAVLEDDGIDLVAALYATMDWEMMNALIAGGIEKKIVDHKTPAASACDHDVVSAPTYALSLPQSSRHAASLFDLILYTK